MNRFTYWLLALIVVVGGVVGVIAFSGGDGEEGGDGFDIKLSEQEWAKWNEESEIVVIEYSDFQCPACAARLDDIEDLGEEFGDYVKFVYRHLPLQGIHPNAKKAAMAAEAAGAQGDFWSMHDLLFENQNEWNSLGGSDLEQKFVEYAEEIGLDTEKFEEDLNSKEVKDAIEEDIALTEELEIGSTPTFFINDRKLGTQESSYASMREILTEEIRNQE